MGKPDAPLFLLRDVVKTRSQGPGYALSIPWLRVEPGDRIAITGPSGCGKSTALDILGMVLAVDGGSVFTFHPDAGHGAGELDVLACWREGRRDLLAAARLAHVGYVLQTGGLLPFLSVRENMEVTAALLGPHNRAEREERTRAMAETLGIVRLLDAMPDRLSIGERQRVAIARALFSRPSLVLADEPTAALDPHHADAVLDLFLDTAAGLGVTLILATHDRRIVERGGLRELVMRLETPEAGSCRAVLESPRELKTADEIPARARQHEATS